MLEKYIGLEYQSYEDFYKNWQIKVPNNFNFDYDVTMNGPPKTDKVALVWCDDKVIS